MNRRRFLQSSALAAAVASTRNSLAAAPAPTHIEPPLNGTAIPDTGWNLWLDRTAKWQDDAIFLPEDVHLEKLSVNPPTGGWSSLAQHISSPDSTTVTLPTTVEQHFWGHNGLRSYTRDEYRYAEEDPIPQNGAVAGVSWWWRSINIPASMHGQRIFLHIRGARMRAEVFLNQQLVGYSIMEELPFECDLTRAAKPGGSNTLAIRITNPGGRYDWVDGNTLRWGSVNIHRSHGFGGLDRELTLTASPTDARLADVYVLNTTDARTITAHVQVEGSGKLSFTILDPRTHTELAHAETSGSGTLRTSLTAPTAKLWDLDSPTLYHLRATLTTASGATDTFTVPFGFRWFAPVGLGSNALFRLNGRRIKLYSSISWGFWGINGLWPTPELATREVTQAKALGLNCLNFHRNLPKEDVLRAHDRLGLLRYMEPGGGKLAIGKLPVVTNTGAPGVVMEKPTDPADIFCRRFVLEKCRQMVRASRSHPSVIQYTLQNEIGADLANPDTLTPLQIMHAEDPSRLVVLNDGFSAPPRNAAQAWFAPYSDELHRTDKELWGGWWNNHQGAGDQWYDDFYKSAADYTYNESERKVLVEYGEMEGTAVADNHSLIVQQIESHAFGGNGKTYDLADHLAVRNNTEAFLDRWGFRRAFPTAAALFRSIGEKCYASWQQYMENARINDALDFAVISGWESTSIENHSGIVDNMRNHKGDPALIAAALRPVALVAKQHHLCHAVGESAVFDLYLLNDTTRPVTGTLSFTMTDPAGSITKLGKWPAPAHVADQFSYTLATALQTPALTHEGIYTFRFALDSDPAATFTREIWVANAAPNFARKLSVGLSGVLSTTRRQLSALPGLDLSEFVEGKKYDLIIASGVVKGSRLDRAIGEETGLDPLPSKSSAPSDQILGHIPDVVLAVVQQGTPLLSIVPDDLLADGVAKQLAALGAFTYSGQVGDTRAPWMGNWLFVRAHATFAGLPVDRTLGVHYQARGKAANGLVVERAPGKPDIEVIMGYSRDHDRKLGAASLLCTVGNARALVHRAPSFNAPLQQRWLANAVAHLTGTQLS